MYDYTAKWVARFALNHMALFLFVCLAFSFTMVAVATALVVIYAAEYSFVLAVIAAWTMWFAGNAFDKFFLGPWMQHGVELLVGKGEDE